MKNRLFSSIPIKPLKRNVFDLSHEKRLSCNMAELVPVMLQEVIPSDQFRCNGTEMLIRVAPMTAPVMHRINAYTHYFFVPHRLVWDDWKTFITGGTDGKQAPNFPQITLNESIKNFFAPGMLSDYLGVPTCDPTQTITQPITINALPFRAYQLIYNEYYRDQTLQPEIVISKDSTTPSSADMLQIRKRCWEKDYLTSALPFTQRGDDVLLPNTVTYRQPSRVTDISGQPQTSGTLDNTNGQVTVNQAMPSIIDNIESLEVTINDLRTSARLQEYLEKMARAGGRYVEQILALFNVVSDDLQQSRPLYLGGSKQPIVISEVLAHFGSDQIPQGTMAGHGVSVGNGNGFKHFFKEHGYIIGIMSILPRTAYMNGIDRTFIKETKFDFYTPDFAHLGEQPVFNAEVYHDYVNSSMPQGVFGYQSRYSEYKFQRSTIHGDFLTSLDYWHMGRKLGPSPIPSLNGSFVEADPTTRIFAVEEPNVHHIWVQLYNHLTGIRPIPVFGIPKL